MSCSRIQCNLFWKHLLIAEDKEFTKGTGKVSKQSYSVCYLKDHSQIHLLSVCVPQALNWGGILEYVLQNAAHSIAESKVEELIILLL